MSLVHGQNPSGYLKPLLVDASGNVLIAGTVNANLNAGANIIGKVDINSSPTLDVHLMTGANLAGKIDVNSAPTLTVQGTQSDKLLAISDRLAISAGSSDLAAGDNNFTASSVPAGQFYHIGTVGFWYYGTITNVTLLCYFNPSGNVLGVASNNAPINAKWTMQMVDLYLKPGDQLKFVIYNATLHDQGFFSVTGHILHTT